jgi:hypothetical protein
MSWMVSVRAGQAMISPGVRSLTCDNSARRARQATAATARKRVVYRRYSGVLPGRRIASLSLQRSCTRSCSRIGVERKARTLLRTSALKQGLGTVDPYLSDRACAELLGTLMYQFAVGKNIGGAVHPLLSTFLNVR